MQGKTYVFQNNYYKVMLVSVFCSNVELRDRIMTSSAIEPAMSCAHT